MLFSLPFAGVGVGMGVWLATMVVGDLRTQHWVEVPATILQAKLETSHGSKLTAYKATARYEYQYQGRRYTSDCVSFSAGSDNIGSFQQDVHRQLSEHQQAGKPFRCYVNPDRPEQAILYRDLRREMIGFQTIFELVFGGVGFGLLATGILGRRKGRAETKLKEAHPEAPWMWKEEWAGGRITSSNKTLLWISIVFALIWNLVSSPLWFVLPNEVIGKGNRLALLGLVFPLVGMGLAVWAIYTLLQLARYRQSLFQMASVPGVLGGQLAGVIHVSANILPQKVSR